MKDIHIEKILHKSKYVISESPKYIPIADDFDNDDVLPDSINVAPITKADSNVLEADETEPVEDQEQTAEVEPTVIPEPEIVPQPVDNNDTQDEVDKVQNSIIKANISIMKKMQDEIELLNNKINSLSTQVVELDTDVEEVKEPTDEEKLGSRKKDSHPFYMNLNDLWSGNEFHNRNDFNEMGMKKLDDGTYIADFDVIKNYINTNDDL
jgi:hypothetical protein